MGPAGPGGPGVHETCTAQGTGEGLAQQLLWTTYLPPGAGEHKRQGEASEGPTTVSSSPPLSLSSPSSPAAAGLGQGGGGRCVTSASTQTRT